MNETNQSSVTCKYCGSTEGILKYGTYKGVPRYWCKSCQRKFKADDTTFHMKTPTNEVTSALNMYYEGMSIEAIRRNLQQEQGHSPSTATIYEWIQKYTQYATDSIKGYKPKDIGNIWIADETVIEIDGQNVWLWDVIDNKTRYLLATRISRGRTKEDAQILMDKAVKTAGKDPQKIITDSLASYLDVRYGKDTEHIQSRPFALGNNTQMIERFHSTLKQRTKVMRGLKNIETAHDFVAGWLVHYNYLRPHTALNNKTPAEAAGVIYPYHNWADIIRKHKPSVKIESYHVPRGTMRMPSTRIGRTPRISRRTPRITPRPPRLSGNQVYIKDGVMSRHYFKGARRGRML